VSNSALPAPAGKHYHALRNQWQQQLRSHRAIGVIRTADWQVGRQMAIAAAAGGIRLLEVTWNSDCPAQLVQALRADLPDCVVGAGTLRSPQDVAAAIAAKVQFAFMPHFQPTLVATLLAAQIPAIPGALTPTEIRTAWDFGATSVKIFPAGPVGGPAYIRAIAPVFEDVSIIPTGGVTLDNVTDFLGAGAIAVGVSGCLFPTWTPQTQAPHLDLDLIQAQAQKLCQLTHPWRS
jgi:2-dehydro-3-deoxyphosphogluconate aldolase/(4S)-4-hydroxy-2-oxoglutarate aldolase